MLRSTSRRAFQTPQTDTFSDPDLGGLGGRESFMTCTACAATWVLWAVVITLRSARTGRTMCGIASTILLYHHCKILLFLVPLRTYSFTSNGLDVNCRGDEWSELQSDQSSKRWAGWLQRKGRVADRPSKLSCIRRCLLMACDV